MKKVINILAFFILPLSFGTLSAESGTENKSVFYVKVVSGNPSVVEKLCLNKFGEEYHYGTSSMVFSIEASAKEKLAFVEMMKSSGLQIETIGTNQYKVSVIDTSPRDQVYSVDTSELSASDVVSVQKILGAGIKGGKADKLRLNDAKIAQMRVDLGKIGFDADFSTGKVLVKELQKTITITCPPELSNEISENISGLSSDIRKGTNGALRVETKAKKISDIAEKIRGLKSVSKLEQRENGDIVVSALEANKYKVKIYVGASKYARRILEKMGHISGLEIENGFINKSASNGTMRVEFDVSSMKKSESEIKEEFYVRAKRAVSSIRESDVKISNK